MKVGDLIKVKDTHWRESGRIGIIISELNNKGFAFKVLLSNGKILPKLANQIDLISI